MFLSIFEQRDIERHRAFQPKTDHRAPLQLVNEHCWLPPTLLTHKIRSPRLVFHSCTTPRVSILILNWSMLLLPFTTDMPAGLELTSTLISRCRYPAQTETPPRPEYRGTPPFQLSQRKGNRRIDLSRDRQSFLTTFSALLHCASNQVRTC